MILEGVELVDQMQNQRYRFFVYTDARSVKSKDGPAARRHYLKSGENAYIEFGARKYYPQYQEPAPAPKAAPVGQAQDG